MQNEKDYFKYFINLITISNSKLPYLPLELRQNIWDKAFKKSYIECNLCQRILCRFDNSQNHIFIDYSIINGIGICWSCRYAEDIMF